MVALCMHGLTYVYVVVCAVDAHASWAVHIQQLPCAVIVRSSSWLQAPQSTLQQVEPVSQS